MTQQKLTDHQIAMGIVADRTEFHLTDVRHGLVEIAGGRRRTAALGFDEIGHHMMLAGIQHRDRAHVGVLIDAHAQCEVGASSRRRQMKDASQRLRIILDEDIDILDVALLGLCNAGGQRDGREGRILGTIGRLHIDDRAPLDDRGIAKVLRTQQGFPDIDRRLHGRRRGAGGACPEQGHEQQEQGDRACHGHVLAGLNVTGSRLAPPLPHHSARRGAQTK